MTIQNAIFDGLPTGLTLSGKAFAVASPDTEVTGNSIAITEGTTAKGRYAVAITRATALPAGDYDIRLFVGAVPIAVGRFRFAGTDGETATEVPQAVELDSAAVRAALGMASADLDSQLDGIADEVGSVAASVAAYAARLALEVQLRGFPNVICRNADYVEETESEIRLTIEDLTGAAITEIAGTPVANLTWLLGMGTEQQPNLIDGTCAWDADTDELVIEIPKESTATVGTGTLTWQVGVTVSTKTRWLGGGTTRLIERQF